MTVTALFVFTPGRAGPSLLASTNDSYVSVNGTSVRIGNSFIERSFDAAGGAYGTVEVLDKLRPGNRWEGAGDFPTSPSALPGFAGWRLAERSAWLIPGGVEVHLRLEAAGLTVERTARVLDGTAAVRMQTTLLPTVPLALTEYGLERLRAESPHDPTAYTARAVGFNGGSDWHDFDYRKDIVGATIDAEAEWFDVQGPAGTGALAMLMQRRNYHSSRMEWTAAGEAVAKVDFNHDLLYTGPIEASAGPVEPGSVRNPAPVSGRARVVAPGGRLALEPVIVALGADKDEAAWHAQKMLASDTQPYTNTFNFNTDKTHTPGPPPIDVGARDGVNFEVFKELLPIARDLGVETFVFDDGWQLYNGDWWPDQGRYNDAIGEGFDDAKNMIEAEEMRMGLWMAPGAFHPNGTTFNKHPEWACVPTGVATGTANAGDPNGDRFLGGSAAPGIGLWNLEAVGTAGAYKDKLRSDIENLISTYNVAEFKFDFLVWVDCANPKPATMYDYHDAFFSTIDSLAMDHPEVGFGVDETNDYRSFPFESILRGPTWFQNGQPDPDELLHNVWSLAPFVPGRAIGQSVRIEPNLTLDNVDERMAVALAYHPTFWTDIRTLAGKQQIIDRVKEWTTLFKSHRRLSGFAYPLLSDPLGGGRWSGLQPWDAGENSGYLMVYRLGAPNADQVVQLRAIPDGMTFSLTEIRPGMDDILIGTFTSAELQAGILLTISTAQGARIFRIDPL